MELIKLTDEIQRKRSCGVVSLFVLERKETIGWEELILLKTSFLAENSSVDKLKKEIHPVVSRSLANKIPTKY